MSWAHRSRRDDLEEKGANSIRARAKAKYKLAHKEAGYMTATYSLRLIHDFLLHYRVSPYMTPLDVDLASSLENGIDNQPPKVVESVHYD